MKRIIAVLLILVLAIFVVGCSSYKGNPQELKKAPEQPANVPAEQPVQDAGLGADLGNIDLGVDNQSANIDSSLGDIQKDLDTI